MSDERTAFDQKVYAALSMVTTAIMGLVLASCMLIWGAHVVINFYLYYFGHK